MTAIVLADVTDVCPDITRVSALWLSWVNTNVSVDTFDGEEGLTTKLVRIYLAAHFTVIGDQLGGASGGAVIGETEGGIARQYSAPDVSKSALNRTGYGQAVLGLIRMFTCGAGIAT